MKQFFKYMLASTLGSILGMFLFGLIFFIIVMGAISTVTLMAGKKGEKISIKDHTVLKLDFNDPIVERTENDPFKNFSFGGIEGDKSISLSALLKAIEKAKTDDKISGLYINTNGFVGGLSQMKNVREAIADFKESGKFVVAYSEALTQGGYYISSVADELYMFHEGFMDFRGLATQLMFFKGTLDKIGVEAMVFRGEDNKFKSAVEPFIYDKMSDESRLQMESMLTGIWDVMTEDISESRGITVEEINRIADELAVRSPEDAVKLNLVDELKYEDEIRELLKMKSGILTDTLATDEESEEDAEEEDLHLLDIRKYANAKIDTPEDEVKDKPWELKDQIAVIYAVGGINSGEGDNKSIGSETLAETIREARKDEDVKAIVMRVSSPGGSAMASDVIWRETVLAKQEKPFIVSFGDVAASGGYYISTHADKIFADEYTITGSIGAFALVPNAQELFNDKLGITFDAVKTNKHADWGGIGRPLDEVEQQLLQGYIDEVYRDFVGKVADGRGMTYEQVDSIGRGRVWVGLDAKEIGLVDEFGTLDDAVAYAAEKAGVEKYELLYLPEQKDFFEELVKELGGDMKGTVAGWLLGEEYKMIEKFREVQEMEGIQMRMLYDFKIK